MKDTKAIEEIGGRLRGKEPPLEITVHCADEASELASEFARVAGLLVSAAGDGAVLQDGRGEDIPACPALSFSGEDRGTIHYLALPEGQEKEPFGEMISGHVDDDLRSNLCALVEPAEILVFIASACPHCPGAVRAANGLALASRRVTTTIIDVQRFPELAERFNVSHVPVTVLDGELLVNEVVPTERLATLLLARGTAGYEEELLLSQVGSGNSDLAVHRILDSPPASEAFLALWRKSTLTLRMGLLVTAEDVLEEAPGTLNGIVGGLIEALGSDDGALRGDTADLLGRIGHVDARAPLEAMLDDANPDIVEIVEEALENIAGGE